MSEASVWSPVSIGIGSNLDEPCAQVRAAITSLKVLRNLRVNAVSSLYRSAPLGPPGQPDYVNATAIALTRMSPQDLLAQLQAIENAQGRDRASAQRWGPRRIDLDLLTCGWRQIDEQNLTIPHPGISERNFVLLPLFEIAPHLPVPGAGSVSELLRRLTASGDDSDIELIA